MRPWPKGWLKRPIGKGSPAASVKLSIRPATRLPNSRWASVATRPERKIPGNKKALFARIPGKQGLVARGAQPYQHTGSGGDPGLRPSGMDRGVGTCPRRLALGREPINGAAEAPKWRTYRPKVTAAKAGGLCKGTLGRDGSHFGVPSGFDPKAPSQRRKHLKYCRYSCALPPRDRAFGLKPRRCHLWVHDLTSGEPAWQYVMACWLRRWPVLWTRCPNCVDRCFCESLGASS